MFIDARQFKSFDIVTALAVNMYGKKVPSIFMVVNVCYDGRLNCLKITSYDVDDKTDKGLSKINEMNIHLKNKKAFFLLKKDYPYLMINSLVLMDSGITLSSDVCRKIGEVDMKSRLPIFKICHQSFLDCESQMMAEIEVDYHSPNSKLKKGGV